MNAQVEEVPEVPVMDIDGKQYALADMTKEQNHMIDQIKDLEAQLHLNEFKQLQLLHGRKAYIDALKLALEGGD